MYLAIGAYLQTASLHLVLHLLDDAHDGLALEQHARRATQPVELAPGSVGAQGQVLVGWRQGHCYVLVGFYEQCTGINCNCKIEIQLM